MPTGQPESSLEPPVLLLAMPQVADPFFHRSVVLLAFHDDEGSFGLILNRPTDIKLQEVLDGMQIPWHGDPGALAYFGGPVQPQVGTILYAPTGNGGDGASTPILPGVEMSQDVSALEDLARKPPTSFRLFLGYAGWGSDQLLDEILRNDWLTAPPRRELLFDENPERLWESAVRSVGVDPATLPSWTAEEGTETN